MQSCYCPSCKDVRGYQINERLGVKAAASLVGGVSKAAGLIADQVQYEEDKGKHWRPIADNKLAHNEMKTQQYANTASRLTEMAAGGTHEARCQTCKNVIEFPDAQNFEQYKIYTHVAHAHKNRWPLAILGFFLGAGVAALFGKVGANATYSLLCIGMGVAGFVSPKFISPVWNSYLSIAFSSMRLIWGLAFGFVVVTMIGAAMGKVVLGISMVAYAAFAGWVVYNQVKTKIQEQKELFATEIPDHKNVA